MLPRRSLLCGGPILLLSVVSCSNRADEVVTLDPESPYAKAVVRQVGPRIIYPKSAREGGLQGDVRVAYFIRRTGELRDVRLESSSGNRTLDEAALNAVRMAAPFPPLPEEIKADQVKIVMPVHFRLRSS
jgi:TonB family protein